LAGEQVDLKEKALRKLKAPSERVPKKGPFSFYDKEALLVMAT